MHDRNSTSETRLSAALPGTCKGKPAAAAAGRERRWRYGHSVAPASRRSPPPPVHPPRVRAAPRARRSWLRRPRTCVNSKRASDLKKVQATRHTQQEHRHANARIQHPMHQVQVFAVMKVNHESTKRGHCGVNKKGGKERKVARLPCYRRLRLPVCQRTACCKQPPLDLC